jgi:hypothetical protein
MDKQTSNANGSAGGEAAQKEAGKRTYLSQGDVPAHSLEDALRIAFVIAEQYGKHPTRPVDVATALGILPGGTQFKTLSGAAVAYGVTEGGAQADEISLTDLGQRIVAPLEEGDDVRARREALLRPRVVREFLQRYDSSPLPSVEIGRNVLETLEVPSNRTQATWDLIVEGADSLGLLSPVHGRSIVNLRPSHLRVVPESPEKERGDVDDSESEGTAEETSPATELPEPPSAAISVPPSEALMKNRSVFVSHGANMKIVGQVRELLAYGDFDPVISVEKEATAKPVPEKVLGDMRSCGAGVIHVGVEKTITDAEGNEHPQLNPNVLIEIGAAMALYGTNFILLVEEGTKLPSNLQGLYEVRYSGKVLDADVTLKLLRAFKEFKSAN